MTDLAAPTTVASTERDAASGLLGAGIAVLAWGAGSVIAKSIDMGGMAIAIYRFGLFAVLLIGWLVIRRVRFDMHVMRHSALGGIALGVDVALFFSAIKLTNVVNATLIGSLQPIFVGIVAATIFGERIARRDVAWSGVAITGVVLVVLASNGTPQWSLRGDLLALGATMAWGAYFVASKQSKGKISPTQFTAGTSLWTAIVNVPLGLAFGQDLSWPTAESWKWLIFMVLSAGLVGHSLMNWSLVRIPLWIGSVMTLLIPIVASLIAWRFLDEPLSVQQVAAMGLVLGALAVIIRNQSSQKLRERNLKVGSNP
ncbi:MAG: DMT family transporter [Acidimicrobiales bacterium]|nr:DMT family transporter [Acidimicrobiales bacterium]